MKMKIRREQHNRAQKRREQLREAKFYKTLAKDKQQLSRRQKLRKKIKPF